MLAVPASASAALAGRSHGSRLAFGGGRATLTLPAPAKRLQPFQVACGAAGQEESVVAIAPLSGGQTTLSAPSPAPRSKRCVVRKSGRKVASIRLHRKG